MLVMQAATSAAVSCPTETKVKCENKLQSAVDVDTLKDIIVKVMEKCVAMTIDKFEHNMGKVSKLDLRHVMS